MVTLSSFWSFDFLADLLKLLKPAHSHSPTHPTKLEKSIRKKLLKLKFPPREAEKTHLRRPMLLEFFGGRYGGWGELGKPDGWHYGCEAIGSSAKVEIRTAQTLH